MLRQWAFTRPRARQLVVFRRVAPPAAAGADPGGCRRRLSSAGRPCALPGGGSPAGRAAPRAAVGRAPGGAPSAASTVADPALIATLGSPQVSRFPDLGMLVLFFIVRVGDHSRDGTP